MSSDLQDAAVKRVLILACILAFAGKLALTLTSYGTNDMLLWEADLRKIQSDGGLALYHDGAMVSWQGKTYRGDPFNHPPFMIYLLQAWGAASAVSGIPLRVWLRGSCAIADLVMLLLAYRILKAEGLPVRPPILSLLALSPVSILVSGFHGNTDPIMVCLLLLSICLIDTGRPVWLAGAAFGMALNIKVVPVIFLPAILVYLAFMRLRIKFALSAGAVFLAASMPFLAHDPALVMRSVFGYNPVSGSWGLPAIALLVSSEALAGYLVIGKYLALGIVFLASIWIHTRAPRCPLFLQCGFMAFLFLFFASGFGTQYLAWLVPWSAALPWRKFRWNYTLMGAYVFLYYGAFSRWGWSMARAAYAPPSVARVAMLQAACWISVGIVTVAIGREVLNFRCEPSFDLHG